MLKMLPYEYYEIDAVEGWLDEQYRSGLSLRSIRGRFCRFDRCAPGLGRYRLHVKPKLGYQGEEERIAQYREMGWEYVTMLTPKVDIYRAITPDAVEMNTDEELLRETMKHTLRSLLLSAILGFVWVIYMIALLIRIAGNFGGFWSTYLFEGIAWLPVCLCNCFVFLAICITAFSSWYSIRKRALLERSYHTPQRARRRSRLQSALLIVGVVLMICSIAINCNNNRPLTIVTEPCPYPLMSLVFPDEPITMRDSWGESSPRYQRTKYEEYGASRSVGHVQYYPCGCTVDIMDIRSEKLASHYVQEYTENWEQLAENIWFSTDQLEIDFDDTTVVFPTQSLLWHQGTQVVEFTSQGSGDLKAVLPYLT